ncbi:MAG: polysaccharide biosynthesis protein [Acidobacteria bacterium]|nr:polysaccharide biosynthesis protein [Acidobacteriota bacterium]
MRESVSDRLWFLRKPLQFLVDMAVLSGAFFLAYLPAINMQLGEFYVSSALSQLPLVVLVQFAALTLTGAYSILWRYVSIEDVRVFLRAAIISGAVLIGFRYALIFTHFNLWQVPISVIVIDTVLAFGGLLSLRVTRRFIYELGDKRSFRPGSRKLKQRSALVVGAGRLGAALAKDVVGRRDAALQIRGFVDDDQHKQGGSVSGIKILGSTYDLPRLVSELGVEEVVIAIDKAQGKTVRRILEICGEIPVKAQIIPSLGDIAQGQVSINRLRDVEIEDLLGREPVKLNNDNLEEFLTGKVVMVTGGGGSIGSELVRQIAGYKPKRLVMVERAEFMLFQIDRELKQDFPDLDFIPLLADAGEEQRMRQIFNDHKPEVVFHAAANKHVPLMEINPEEAVKNNVFATRVVGNLAGEFGTRHFVLISTDKAVNPTSIMGASKRAAEIVVQTLNHRFETKYTSVRFGNVLGSAGSVVPIFREQIRKGLPITVTHPEMTRYFMTIPEASQLVLQAGALGEGGEIFILDMGEPVKVLDLAEDMIRLSGLTPYEDVDIVFTGIRPGEKLFEELEISGEKLLKTKHPKIYIGKIAEHPQDDVVRMLTTLAKAVEAGDEEMLRYTLSQFIPEVQFSEESAKVKDTGRENGMAKVSRSAKLGMASE